MPQQILDSYVDDAVARTREAKDADTTEALEKEIGPPVNPEFEKWVNRLPRNIGVGLYRAALNTIETVDDVFEAGAELIINDPRPTAAGQIGEALRREEGKAPKPAEGGIDPVRPLQTMFPDVFEAAHNFADEAEESNTFSDDITQGIAQFTIPFMGYLKALGGIKNVKTLTKVGRLALAEGTTAASAFEAHEGRIADVAEMGRQMENKFGAVLNKIAPDGSLANAYIDWMTDRENESALGGRFKNAVDSLVVTGGIVAVLKALGKSIKASHKSIVDPEKLKLPANTRFAEPAAVAEPKPATPVAEPKPATPVAEPKPATPAAEPRVTVASSRELSKAEKSFFDVIWNSPPDRRELLEEVPGAIYKDGHLSVPEGSMDALTKYVDDTVILRAGDTMEPRLPPSFYKDTFTEKFVRDSFRAGKRNK